MKIVHCRSCNADIVFLLTHTNRMTPVNADTVKEGDKHFDRERHTSHFATCPDAQKYRGAKRTGTSDSTGKGQIL